MDPKKHTVDPETLKAVRARLLLRGQSLSSWAKKNGVKRQNLSKALSGEWQGPKAFSLIQHLLQDVGME